MTAGHLRQILELLSGMYDYVVVDIDKRLEDRNLMVLDVADTIFAVMTADLSCLKNVRLLLETIGHLGYEHNKLKLVLNRSNAFTGISVKSAEGALRRPDRVPGGERVPGRDLRAQHRGAVHDLEGRLGAGAVGARLRAAASTRAAPRPSGSWRLRPAGTRQRRRGWPARPG